MALGIEFSCLQMAARRCKHETASAIFVSVASASEGGVVTEVACLCAVPATLLNVWFEHAHAACILQGTCAGAVGKQPRWRSWARSLERHAEGAEGQKVGLAAGGSA
eukprot:627172-Pleurochrysis_carterae.AAC.2